MYTLALHAQADDRYRLALHKSCPMLPPSREMLQAAEWDGHIFWLHELPDLCCKLAGWQPHLQQIFRPPPERPLRASVYVDEVRQGSLGQDLTMPAQSVQGRHAQCGTADKGAVVQVEAGEPATLPARLYTACARAV